MVVVHCPPASVGLLCGDYSLSYSSSFGAKPLVDGTYSSRPRSSFDRLPTLKLTAPNCVDSRRDSPRVANGPSAPILWSALNESDLRSCLLSKNYARQSKEHTCANGIHTRTVWSTEDDASLLPSWLHLRLKTYKDRSDFSRIHYQRNECRSAVPYLHDLCTALWLHPRNRF